MTQILNITGRVTNTSTSIQQKHGAASKSLTVDNFEAGELIDVINPTPGEVTIAIPSAFVNNSFLTLLDETAAADIVAGEFVEYGILTGAANYFGKLSPGIPAVLELNDLVTQIFLTRNAAGTSKIRYHLFAGV